MITSFQYDPCIPRSTVDSHHNRPILQPPAELHSLSCLALRQSVHGLKSLVPLRTDRKLYSSIRASRHLCKVSGSTVARRPARRPVELISKAGLVRFGGLGEAFRKELLQTHCAESGRPSNLQALRLADPLESLLPQLQHETRLSTRNNEQLAVTS